MTDTIVPTKSAKEYSNDLAKQREDIAKIFEGKKTAEGTFNLSADEIVEVRRRNEEAGKLAQLLEAASDLETIHTGNDEELKALKTPNGVVFPGTQVVAQGQPLLQQRATKSLGELFTESDAFKNSKGLGKGQIGPAFELDLAEKFGKAVARHGIKALFDTATGYAPQAIRLPEPITPFEEGLSVAALMPEGQTSQNAVPYMEETTTTNAAAEIAEGLAKPESALALTEKTSAVRKIATHLPITDEALEDVPFIESYIDTRLRLFVRQREDGQLLAGDGAAPNLRGILNTAGILTQAKGADPTPDAVYKAMTKIRVQGFMEPTGAVFHPNDWQDVRLLRTADGIYIWGSPSEAGPERIWGLQVVQTSRMTENTALVGAFRLAAQIFRRSELAMQIGWINDQFVKNQRTILVEERLALVVFRPKGFATVTGI